MNKIPNIFLLGAPKSGTSSLFDWLTKHPDIEGTNPKETFFLVDRENPLLNTVNNVHKSGKSGYARFFSKNSAAKVRVDATTHHLFQQTALEFCKTLEKKPLGIVLLRNPVSRICSSFAYSKNNLGSVSQNLSIDLYVEAILNKDFDSIQKLIHSPQARFVLGRNLQYSKYVNFLRPWREVLGTDNLLLFEFEYLKNNPVDICREISRRINLDESFFNDSTFLSSNETRAIGNPRIHRALKQFSPIAKKLVGLKKIKEIYFRWQSIGVQRENDKSLDSELKGSLRRYFEKPNQELIHEFGLKHHWCRNSVGPS